jgi:ABC-type sugar transport system ATPase subunit
VAGIAIERLCKEYPGGVRAVSDVTLEIADGEFVVLVGPSGCGKSTILRMVAGLEEVSSGTIRIDGRIVNDVPPGDRDIAMVFQNYALYPHMSVRDNLSFGLRVRKFPARQIEERVRRAADALAIGPLLDRRPRELSGGQRQRVALGRAIVRDPKVFLFDEPLSNLDAKLRAHMRAEIARLHRRLRTTVVYVTHDQVEAMTLGDRIVIVKGGEVQQVAAPMEIYARPANRFVAGFIGSPTMNFLEGAVRARSFVFGARAFELGRDVPDGPAVLGIRPEDLVVDGTAPLLAEGCLDVAEQMGHETIAHVDVDGQAVVARLPPDACRAAGDRLRLGVRPGRWHLFATGETGRRLD